MKIEPSNFSSLGHRFGMLVRAETPVEDSTATELAKALDVSIFTMSSVVKWQSGDWESIFRRFKQAFKTSNKAQGSIFIIDIASESPLQLVKSFFLRLWLKSVQKQNMHICVGLLIQQHGETWLRTSKLIKFDWGKGVLGRGRLKRYLLTKLDLMDSALEIWPYYEAAKPLHQQDPIAAPQDPDIIKAEISSLPAKNLLCRQAEFEVWIAQTPLIPVTMLEIGRLREITFRSVNEGTGRQADTDEYDLYYDQLIIWDAREGRIAGGYRLGRGDRIFSRYGKEGFYINSLFRIDDEFCDIFPQSLELGRSYIIEEYQRKRLPLFLLWKGILHFLLANPGYRYLYGPVSISSHYSEISKSLIVYFLRKHHFDNHLAKFLKPRKKFQYRVDEASLEFMTSQTDGDLDRLNQLIEDIEPHHLKLPVLLRQYIRQNARFISFNIDPNFSDALDGFILLDLANVPHETIEALQKEKEPEGE